MALYVVAASMISSVTSLIEAPDLTYRTLYRYGKNAYNEERWWVRFVHLLIKLKPSCFIYNLQFLLLNINLYFDKIL